MRQRIGTGEKSAMHGHPESVAVFSTEADSKFTHPGGRTEDIAAMAGSAIHMETRPLIGLLKNLNIAARGFGGLRPGYNTDHFQSEYHLPWYLIDFCSKKRRSGRKRNPRQSQEHRT